MHPVASILDPSPTYKQAGLSTKAHGLEEVTKKARMSCHLSLQHATKHFALVLEFYAVHFLKRSFISRVTLISYFQYMRSALIRQPLNQFELNVVHLRVKYKLSQLLELEFQFGVSRILQNLQISALKYVKQLKFPT